MTTVLRFLFVIPIGFIAACFAAAVALLWPFLDLSDGALDDPIVAIELFFGFMAQSAQVGSMALVPWAIFMVLTEILRQDSLLIHAGAGLLGGFAASRLAFGGVALSASLQTAFVVAGLSFALLYWIVAGRRAGHWRRRAARSPSDDVAAEARE